jgi:hypothetical protein
MKPFAISLLTAASILTASQAWALETEIVVTGSLVAYNDSTHSFFGDTATLLDGDAFTADVFIDTSLGKLQTIGTNDSLFTSGALNGYPSNGVTATVSINGYSYSINEQGFDSVGLVGLANSPQTAIEITIGLARPNLVSNFLSIYLPLGGSQPSFPSEIGQAFSVPIASDSSWPLSYNSFNLLDAGGDIFGGYLTVTNIFSSGVSAIPELPALPMMVVGLGLLGGFGRRKQQRLLLNGSCEVEGA